MPFVGDMGHCVEWLDEEGIGEQQQILEQASSFN
jgi:hypothetical protein